jgi:hypothetical protein
VFVRSLQNNIIPVAAEKRKIIRPDPFWDTLISAGKPPFARNDQSSIINFAL